MYIHQVVYNNKLENKCTITLLNPKLLYVGPIQAKGHLSFRDTCPPLYSYLFVPCLLCLAACGAVNHQSILCNVGQLPTHTMQYWATSNMHYSAFSVAYIIFVLFCDHIYKKIYGIPTYLGHQTNTLDFYTPKNLTYHNFLNIYLIEMK